MLTFKVLAGRKLVGLAATVAIATLITIEGCHPALPESLGSGKYSQTGQTKINPSGNQISSIERQQDNQVLAVGSLAAITLASLGFVITLVSAKNKENFEAELKNAKEIANLAKGIKENLKPDVLKETNETNQLLQTAVAKLIQDYHTQALTQATAQFWFSITAACFGFALILYVAISPIRSKEQQNILLNTIPGIAIEAVAALFFTQAQETRKRSTELYDRLRLDWEQSVVVELIDKIENLTLRDLVKAHWALHMAGIKTQPIDLGSYAAKGNRSNNRLHN